MERKDYLVFLEWICKNKSNFDDHPWLYRTNKKYRRQFLSKGKKEFCNSLFCFRHATCFSGKYRFCAIHDLHNCTPKQNFIEKHFNVEIFEWIRKRDIDLHGLSKGDFVQVLQTVSEKNGLIPRYSVMNREENVRHCSVVNCNRTEIKRIGNLAFCKTHLERPYSYHIKEDFLLCEFYSSFLSELDICREKKSEELFTEKVCCGRIACEETEKLVKAYGGTFCRKHVKEIKKLRNFKKNKVPLHVEIALRWTELQIRKEKDPGHDWYVRFLERKLLK